MKQKSAYVSVIKDAFKVKLYNNSTLLVEITNHSIYSIMRCEIGQSALDQVTKMHQYSTESVHQIISDM